MKRSKFDTPNHASRTDQTGEETAPDAPLVGQFMHQWFRFGRAIKREIVPVLERDHGADFFEFMVLNCIEEGTLHPGGVAETLVVPPSQVSRTLEGLTKRGLVRRSLDHEDSRRVVLELTGQGQEVLGAVYATIRTMLEPSFEQTGREHVRDVIRVVERLTQAISNHDLIPAPDQPEPDGSGPNPTAATVPKMTAPKTTAPKTTVLEPTTLESAPQEVSR
jgi:DNA-binding MarR family transcriptional regulator